jgi:hypothetical protein
MGWFSRKLPDSEKEGALALVRHLQGILAYQQLAMETYNDAFAAIAGEPPLGAEAWNRPQAVFDKPELVSKYIIPALEKKIEILKLMETKHQSASTMATSKFLLPYQEMTSAIQAMLDRAHLQYDGFTQLVRGSQTFSDSTSLDEAETLAIDRAVMALNNLIYEKIGLTPDQWLDIVWEAFNSVRDSLGLAPLDNDVFRSLYFSGLQGKRVRFFSD